MLRAGELVAFPTETVYGLGARADDPDAVALLYRTKRRPQNKKTAIMVPDYAAAERHAGTMPPAARRLAEAFWPGPLTLVVPDGRGGFVGVRCPDCSPTLRMLELAGLAVMAPSANLSGAAPAVCAPEVLEHFTGKIAAVLDGGRCAMGQASTVARLSGENVEILREGPVTAAEITACLRPPPGGSSAGRR